MKLALMIIAVTSAIAVALYYATMDQPEPQSVAMPWQVAVHDPQHSEIFGIILNQTNLEQARQRFGLLEGVALFRDPQDIYSLEAYFGKVSIGPFAARIIATLEAPQSDLEALLDHTVKRVRTDNGSLKWTLTQDKVAEQSLRKIKSLSYIPSYRGMDSEFIAARFGEPSRREPVGETAQLWYYPSVGVRVLVDSDGNEMFEYLAPADFQQAYGAS